MAGSLLLESGKNLFYFLFRLSDIFLFVARLFVNFFFLSFLFQMLISFHLIALCHSISTFKTWRIILFSFPLHPSLQLTLHQPLRKLLSFLFFLFIFSSESLILVLFGNLRILLPILHSFVLFLKKLNIEKHKAVLPLLWKKSCITLSDFRDKILEWRYFQPCWKIVSEDKNGFCRYLFSFHKCRRLRFELIEECRKLLHISGLYCIFCQEGKCVLIRYLATKIKETRKFIFAISLQFFGYE